MPELSPFDLLQHCTGAFYLSRCLQVIAESGVADSIGEEPVTTAALAEATGLHPQALSRVLNLLAAHGVFERRDGGIAHTPASRLLRTDNPRSMRSFVRMFGLPVMWKAAQNLDQAVKTGRSNLDEFWNYLAENPHASSIFNDAMTAKARAQVATVVAAYDFSRFGLVGDIGGGRGHLLQAILAASPNSKGLLFDLPHVIEQASGAASDRLSLRAGDFFRDELPRCEAYILMEIIHDWPDEESRVILNAVRRASPSHAKLLLIEALMPNDPGPSWTKTLDIVMLDLFGGGSQRTTDQYRTLLSDAGFQLERIIDIGAGYSILEAKAE